MNKLEDSFKLIHNLWITIPLIFFSILNFGNYSFLRYNYESGLVPSYINNIKYVRIILPLIPIIYLYGLKRYIIASFLKLLLRHFDLLLFIFVVITHILGNADFIYPFWYITSFFSLLILFFIIRVYSVSMSVFFKNATIFVFLTSVIAIPFTFLSLPRLLSQNEIYFSSKSSFAYYNLILITSSLSYLIISENKIRLKEIIFISINVVVLLLSGRRTPLVTSLVCILIYFLFFSFNYKSLILAVVVSFLFTLNVNFFSENFLSIKRLEKINTEGEFLDSSYEARLELRSFYFKKIEESNFLGIGFEEINSLTSESLSTHNTYLTVFLVLGFFGLLFYLIIILVSIIKVLQTYNSRFIVSYLVLFIPILTINWVETNFMPGQIFYLYTMSIILFPRFIKIN